MIRLLFLRRIGVVSEHLDITLPLLHASQSVFSVKGREQVYPVPEQYVLTLLVVDGTAEAIPSETVT